MEERSSVTEGFYARKFVWAKTCAGRSNVKRFASVTGKKQIETNTRKPGADVTGFGGRMPA